MSFNLLLVDDSKTVRNVIRKCIDLAGVPVSAVFEAANGIEALEQIEANWIDLVFTDINMDGMNGVELIKNLKERDLLKQFPVIVVSTEGSVTRIDELKDLGVSGYLRKPFTPKQIKDIIEEVTGVTG